MLYSCVYRAAVRNFQIRLCFPAISRSEPRISHLLHFVIPRSRFAFDKSRFSASQGLVCKSSSSGVLQTENHPRRVVLGIESSCDDTGVAVVTSDGEILAEVLISQADIHEPWGGVVPKLAQQAHEAAISAAVENVLQMAAVQPEQLDAVAATLGPGLSLCLKVGVAKAKELCQRHGLPYVGVHHMEAHALVARLEADVAFPFVCLLISGGHNMLVTVHGVGQYTLLGSTFDDALGEAYDKIARLLGLSMDPNYGAALEKLAEEGDPLRFRFTAPLQKRRCANFSYAGLKTAVRLAIEAEAPGPPSPGNRQVRADIAASFQHVATRHLAERTLRGLTWALEGSPGIRSLVVAGGVAANKHVRSALAAVAEELGLQLVCPRPPLCTDNGVMVAWAALERLQEGVWQLPPGDGGSRRGGLAGRAATMAPDGGARSPQLQCPGRSAQRAKRAFSPASQT
eukprot:jgi/Botrbrau1/2778/Bobra.0164s0055.1